MDQSEFKVTRAHLKNACQKRKWDLLDRLLEIDSKFIDDKSLFTDDWGSWWGMLVEVIRKRSVDGVKVLLKHGANRNIGIWGDGLEQSPEELAAEIPAILALLRAEGRPEYVRKSDPELPTHETARDRAINHQGEVRDRTGLVFPLKKFES